MRLLPPLIVALVAVLLAVPLYSPKHVFDPVVLKKIANEAIAQGGNSTVVVNRVMASMKKTYPEWIVAEPGHAWFFNVAGGAMGSMTILHASLSEYVIIFGTALGTEGHTGRFLADDWFTILHGEQWGHSAGNLDKEVYKPGDQHWLKFGDTKQYKMPDECWALEYARGNIPSMLPFGVFSVFFNTVDFLTLYDTVKWTLIQMIDNIAKGKV